MGEGGIWGALRRKKRRAGGWGRVEGPAGPGRAGQRGALSPSAAALPSCDIVGPSL